MTPERSGLGVLALAVLFAAGRVAPRPAFPPEPTPGTLFRSLYLPEGAGPFAAVVMLHTCASVDTPNVTVNCQAAVETLRRSGRHLGSR
jgi:hypothetical protein